MTYFADRLTRLSSVPGLMVLSAVAAWGQASPRNMAAPLRVTDVAYAHSPDAKNPGRESAAVTFSVRNDSSRSVVAYSAQVTGNMRDGAKRPVYACEADLTDGFNWPEKDRSTRPNAPLEPGESRDCRFSFSGNTVSIPLSIAISPVYVVLEDSTVLGDRASASNNFFEPQRAMAAVYGRHLAELESLNRSPPEKILDALAAFANGYRDPAGVVLSPRSPRSDSPASRAAEFARFQIASALVGVNQMGNNAARTTPDMLAESVSQLLKTHVARIQRRFDIATKYSNPK